MSALDGQIGVLKGNNPPKDKAVAICWIAHLVGDLHQPLHAVSMYSRQLPKGDRGGNDTYVTFPGRKTTELHGVWDGLLGSDSDYNPVTRISSDLERRPDLARAKLPNVDDLDPKTWVKESFDIAKHDAYLDATIHGGSKTNGFPLPADYGKNSKAIAERQVALAGYRLAAVLVRAIGD